jgi:peptidyl-prolyl cis-trans isomerase C
VAIDDNGIDGTAPLRVDDVELAGTAEELSPAERRQRACTELLRRAAIESGLLGPDDPPPVEGVISERATTAIERLIERDVTVPEPSEPACRRHHAANAARFAHGERVRARHILFAVTPGVEVNGLRRRAEACLLDVRNPTPEEAADGDRFARMARLQSNCPSGAEGGDLGWLRPADCAAEFARELFGRAEVGVLPRLVATRFGLHVVEVLAREPGRTTSFESVREAVTASLRAQSFATAMSQYLQVLAGRARIVGVDLPAARSPLSR